MGIRGVPWLQTTPVFMVEIGDLQLLRHWNFY